MTKKIDASLPSIDTNTYPRGTHLADTLFFQKLGHLYTSHPENPDPATVYRSAQTPIIVDCIECGRPKRTTVICWVISEQVRCHSCVARAVNDKRDFTRLDECENWPEIEPFYADEIDPHTLAATSQVKIAIRCPECGEVRLTSASVAADLHLMCRTCASNTSSRVRPIDSIIVRDPNRVARSWDMEANLARGINIFSTPPNSSKVVSIRCGECGGTYEQTVRQFMRAALPGTCPRCRSSQGEKNIDAVLERYNLFGNPQTEFDGMVSASGWPLYVDRMIALSEEDAAEGRWLMAAEFQGPRHYLGDFFYYSRGTGAKSFQRVQDNDRRKALYLHEHGYPLLAVPYWADSVEDIDQQFQLFCRENELGWLLERRAA